MLKRYTDERPTTHRRGKWVTFSETLFEIATGEHTDMYKACCEWSTSRMLHRLPVAAAV